MLAMDLAWYFVGGPFLHQQFQRCGLGQGRRIGEDSIDSHHTLNVEY